MHTNYEFLEALILKTHPDIDDDGVDLMISDLEEVFWDFLMAKLALAMKDEALGDFTRLVKGGANDGEIMNFLKTNIEDADGYIDEIYAEFETSYTHEITSSSC